MSNEERTRERAIEYLEHYKNVKYGMMPEWVWDMAIKALEQEPCEDATLQDIFCMGCEYKEQEPCEDAIDRKYLTGLMFTEADLSDAHTCYESIRKIVEEMPSVTPIRPKGHWELSYRDEGIEFYMCDRCKKGRAVIDGDYELSEFNFCPNCGADMREEQKNDA